MVDAPRARRLAERIQVIVASMLETRIKDPRLGFVTVTDTRVTNDLQQATIFYTVLGNESQLAETAAALESAKGVLRTEVGRQTGVRFTPSLTFVTDALPEAAQHIDALLREAAERDAEVHRVAATAAPAGDPDPYRTRSEDVDVSDEQRSESPAGETAAGAVRASPLGQDDGLPAPARSGAGEDASTGGREAT